MRARAAIHENPDVASTAVYIVLPLALQVIEPVLGGLENISRRFINNLVWDLILVCIDAHGDWL